jgi:hypothetical protein
MKRREWSIFITAVILILAAAGFLLRWSRLQELGKPGVKVVGVPIPGINPTDEGTNRFFVAGTNSIALPPRVLDYESEVIPVQRIVWDWLPKDTTYGQRRYTAPDGFAIFHQAVLMGVDRTSIHQPQYCLTGSGWRIVSGQPTHVRVRDPHPYDLPVMKLLMHGEFRNKYGAREELSGVFIYWFVADDALTAIHHERMWWMARELLARGVLQRWAYVVAFAGCQPGQEEATYRRLREFIAASTPQFQLAAGPAVSNAPPTVSRAQAN